MFKFKNFKELKTTILSIVAGVIIVAGILWPDRVTEADSEAINVALEQVLIGIGALIGTLSGIFAAKDG